MQDKDLVLAPAVVVAEDGENIFVSSKAFPTSELSLSHNIQ